MAHVEVLKVEACGDRDIVTTCTVGAPHQLVFDALTVPELLMLWGGGPPGWSLVRCEIDLRAGGTWRHVLRGPESQRLGIRGVYREVGRCDRLVTTELLDDPWYPGEALQTTVLIEHRGITTLATTTRYESTLIRNAALRSPAERGLTAGYDRLAGFLASDGARWLERRDRLSSPSAAPATGCRRFPWTSRYTSRSPSESRTSSLSMLRAT
jgi:uncharacterized protein YndB with AHSA1/START domain